MTDSSPPGGLWRPPVDIKKGSLAFATIVLLRAAPRPIWIVMAILLVLSLGMDLIARQMGVPLDGPRFIASTWIYLTGLAMMTSAVVGVVLHMLLTGQAPHRLDTGLIGFVVWTAAVSLMANGLASVIQTAPTAPPAELLPRFALVAIGGLGGVIVLTRLMLLPMAWLVKDPGATLTGSWGRMRGQIVAYIIASLVLSLPVAMIGLLAVGAAGGGAGEVTAGARIAAQLMATAMATLSAALNAVMYLRLVGPPPSSSEVFD